MPFLPDPGENLRPAECQTAFYKSDTGFLIVEKKRPK
jgi:hypothetical protein